MSGNQQLLGMAGGAAVDFIFDQTISVNTANYNLRAAAVTAGWNQTSKLIATITINSGVYVYSTSTGSYAFDTGVTFPTGTTLALINNGTILGMGGAGANGRTTTGGYSAQGSPGGPAFRAQYAISITNNGIVAGGGGGGNGGIKT